MINAETAAALIIAIMGMTVSWGVWVSVSVFKHAQEIALLKQEIRLLGEVKEVLEEIKLQLQSKHHG